MGRRSCLSASGGVDPKAAAVHLETAAVGRHGPKAQAEAQA
jgi:hypothetical protein